MITLDSTFGDVYNDERLKGFAEYFYFGWSHDTHSIPLKDACPNIWPNAKTVESINFYADLNQKGKLAIYYPQGKENCSNIIHLKHNENRKCAIVTGGGGYNTVCNGVEAMPVTQRLYELGFDVFLFTYHILQEAHLAIDDLAYAIKYIFDHNKELNVDPNDYICAGFSAAGHVVGEFGTNNKGYNTYNLPKPGLLVLGYPVIDMGKYTHIETRNNFLGENKSQERIDEYSVQKHIDETYPKTFLWQCLKDDQVDIHNSIMVDEELTKHGVPHIYETWDSSAHGWGIATGKLADGWVDRMVEFYKANKN